MKFLVCGLGSIGARHLKNIISLGYEDIILLRTGKSVLPGVDEYSRYATFDNIENALSQNPDICVISNPTSLHVSTAITAAKAGCHLFIEKPLSNSLEDLVELLEVVESKNLTTLVTYQFRYHPQIKLLRSLLSDEFKYGQVVYASAEWAEYLPDWHPWEDYRKSYAASSNLGGGVLLTQIHPFNYLSFLFGEVESLKIQKFSSKTLGIDVDDTADILIEFENGVSGHVHVDFLQKPRVHTLKIVTNAGKFEWDCHRSALCFVDLNGVYETFNDHEFERNDMFLEMLSEFIKDIKLGQTNGFSVSSAITELRLLLESD